MESLFLIEYWLCKVVIKHSSCELRLFSLARVAERFRLREKRRAAFKWDEPVFFLPQNLKENKSEQNFSRYLLDSGGGVCYT